MSRKFAIGDIHGSNVALGILIMEIEPTKNDTIITLGDYIDRGHGSRQVVEQLLALRKQCNLITLMGNHELLIIRSLEDRSEFNSWTLNGGLATLNSYGWDGRSIGDNRKDLIKHLIPGEHMRFFANCLGNYEDEENIYLHANYHPDLPMAEQTEQLNFWEHIDSYTPEPHISGKTAWVGHTPQRSGNIKDMKHVVCIDTGSFISGWLTAVEVNTGEIIQVNNNNGKIRRKDRNNPDW